MLEEGGQPLKTTIDLCQQMIAAPLLLAAEAAVGETFIRWRAAAVAGRRRRMRRRCSTYRRGRNPRRSGSRGSQFEARRPSAVTARGDVYAYSTLRELGGLGDTRTAAHLNLRSGRFDVFAKGRLTIHARGRITINFGQLLKGAVGPELKQLEALARSDDFSALVQATLTGELDPAAFVDRVRGLLKQHFPAGLTGSAETVLARLPTAKPLRQPQAWSAGRVRSRDSGLGLLLHKSGG